jgi:predicted alpha/beta superfamily hydrolase
MTLRACIAFLYTLALVCAGISLFAAGARAHAEALAAQTPPLSARIETHTLSDAVFGRTRALRVWLPAGYDPRTTAYPVLYLLDGQNLFDAKLSTVSGQEWQVDETAQALINAGILPPMIVVGIDNAPAFGRAEEYLPWPDSAFPNPEQHTVKGARLPDFLRESVIPFIEARYRVDATKRGLGGSSYGGLASLYVAGN